MLLAAAPDSQEKSLQTAAHHAFIKQAQNLSLLSDEDYMVNLVLLTFLLSKLINSSKNNILYQFTCEGEEFLVTNITYFWFSVQNEMN